MESGILQWLLPAALAGLMLGVGLTVSLAELLAAARERRTLFAVLVSMQVVLPAATLVAAWAFQIDSTTATGLVLLASCPGGLFSNYLTALGGGSVPLSIVLTVLVTLVYAAAAPLWASAAIVAFAPDAAPLHHYSPRELLSSLCAFVLAPVVVGIALRSRARRWADGAARYVREPAAVALLVCYGLVLYEMRHTLVAGFAAATAPVLAFNAAALLAAAVVIRVSRVSPRNNCRCGSSTSSVRRARAYTSPPRCSGFRR